MFSSLSLWEILFAFTLAYYLLGFIAKVVVARTTFVTKRMEMLMQPYLPAAFFFALIPKLFRFCYSLLRNKIGDAEQNNLSASELHLSRDAVSLWALLAAAPFLTLSAWLNAPMLLYVPITAGLTAAFLLATSKLGMQRRVRPSRSRRRESATWQELASRSA